MSEKGKSVPGVKNNLTGKTYWCEKPTTFLQFTTKKKKKHENIKLLMSLTLTFIYGKNTLAQLGLKTELD